MKITLICPICNKPLSGKQYVSCYRLWCMDDTHHYEATASTEEATRAILEKAQKELVDALSAKIALPIEQRRHNQLRVKFNQLFYFAKHVRDQFKRDLEQGFTTKDKEYAVELLSKGLE